MRVLGSCFVFLVVTRTASGRLEVCFSLTEKPRLKSQPGTFVIETLSGSSRFWVKRQVSHPASTETMQARGAPLLRALMMSLQAMLCRSVIMLDMVSC